MELLALLRYAKIEAIEGKTVTVVGVHPQTGKHAGLVIETVKDPTLTKLRYCLASKIFVKVFVGDGKTEPNFRFSAEEPSSRREDSYFTLFSYASRVGFNPLFLRKLDHHLVTMGEPPTKELGEHLLNVTDKLGMVFYARDQVVTLKKQRPVPYIEIRYHIVNAIISSKACLDALANILNDVYCMGRVGSKIDLASVRGDMVQRIKKMNRKLGEDLEKHQKWLDDITLYRDQVAHRILLDAVPIAPLSKAPLVKIQIPKSSHALAQLRVGDRSEKDKLWQESEDFFRLSLKELKYLIEIVCNDLLALIESKTYFPT